MTLSYHSISPDIARKHGQETVAIGERGEYRAPSGRTVEIQALVERAVQQTIGYPPEVRLRPMLIG
ncbi:hypothetical protein CCR95_17120 [Thiocystis minor]|uniref:hypothetical protein n=1 Tax=Thiocystis minor TaxID=61597 RepID=UPI0019130CF0|nr:hypothetical protein [Thiocystis minor]MBK5965754.1 hypothetical protein [Thiocystis minor]